VITTFVGVGVTVGVVLGGTGVFVGVLVVVAVFVGTGVTVLVGVFVGVSVGVGVFVGVLLGVLVGVAVGGTQVCSGASHIPRPCVATRIFRFGSVGWMAMSKTETRGSPVPNGAQLVPPFVDS